MSIADLLVRQGDVAAQGARESGRIWGGLATEIGQIPARTYGQILQQRQQKLQDALTQTQLEGQKLALKDKARQDADKITIAQAYKGSLNPDGTFNREGLTSRLAQTSPDLLPQVMEQLDTLDASHEKVSQAKAATQQQALQLQSLMAEHVAAIARTVKDHNYDPGAFGTAMALAQSQGLDISQAQKAVEAGTPIQQIVDTLIAQAPSEQAAAAKVRSEREMPRVVAPGSGVGSIAEGFTTPVPAKAPNSEAKSFRISDPSSPEGFRDVEGDYLAGTGGQPGRYFYNGKDVTGQIAKTPPAGQSASDPGDYKATGDEFLKTIPVQWRATVQKIANYEEDPTKVASMRGGMREQLTRWVNQVNPAYVADEFTNRAPTRKAFTAGTQGQAINAINTGIGHLDQLASLAAGLKNGDFVPGNRLYNWAKTTFGASAVTNFDTLKDALAGEIAKSLNGGAATVSGIADQKAKMGAFSSPDQLAGYVKTLIPTLGSKLSSYNFQYHQAMDRPDGTPDSFSALSPTSKAVLTKYGFDPEHPEIAPAGNKTAKLTGHTLMVGPDGVQLQIPDENVAAAKARGAKVVGGGG